MTPYSAASVANAFLNKAFQEDTRPNRRPISPMMLQKLLYIAHGYFLVEQDKPLLNEVFEAWKFGPVLNSLYHQCKYFRNNNVKRFLREFDSYNRIETERQAPIPDNDDVKDIVDFVWKIYGNESPISLSAWTHERGGPWDKVTKGGTDILLNKEVPNEYIKSYFKDHMQK